MKFITMNETGLQSDEHDANAIVVTLSNGVMFTIEPNGTKLRIRSHNSVGRGVVLAVTPLSDHSIDIKQSGEYF